MNKRIATVCALLLSATLATQADPISRAEARTVAQTLVGIHDTSSDDGAPLAPYYIFSRGAGQGFVIVSGDDTTAPILGYTEQGDYDPASLPPQLQGMLATWKDRITEVQQRQIASGDKPLPRQRLSAARRAKAEFKKDWTDVKPLLKTHWHQSTPYNNLAPIKEGKGRCMSGCVATAGSQVTYYYHKDNPSELTYNTPTYSYGTPITVSLPKGTPIEWNLMKLSGTGTAKQDSAVAKLMYALGTSAWLTYGDGDGLATSGHNEKMAEAMRGQFRLNSKHSYKTEFSQQGWEEIIYNNLFNSRPMLYSGAHPTDGGHSVCLDGYQASSGLYHFNFGWGGQGDGYYTVDDETGMNGFNTYQDLVYDIIPSVQNLEGRLTATTLFQNAATDVEVEVANNGTLDYQGISIFVQKAFKSSGTATGTPVFSDNTLNVEPGSSITFTAPVTATLTDSACVILTDKNRRILDAMMMPVTSTSASLTLSAITVEGSAEVTELDDMTFHNVNNTTATVTATITNGPEATYCQPTMKCFLQRYLVSTKKWMNMTTKTVTVSDQAFQPGETRQVQFTITGLGDGVYYRAYLSDKAVTTEETTITMATADTLAYFMTRKPDLVVNATGRTATVTGRWDARRFADLAVDASVTSYDISGLTELPAEKPEVINPNALFFYNSATSATARRAPAEASLKALADLENFVVNGECKKLTVQKFYDFWPMRPFTAREACMVLDDARPGKWNTALVPFAADAPYGMQVKQAKSYTAGSLPTIEHEATRRAEAMTVVTYLTSRTGLNTLTATDAAVTTDSTAAFFDWVLQAATVAAGQSSKILVPGEYMASLYYVAPAENFTDAFQPYVTGVTATRVRTTNETLVDGYYRSLSTAIDAACDTLAAHLRAPKAAREALQVEITKAQDMLTYRSHKEDTDVKTQRETLNAAVKTFLEAGEAETVTGDVNGDGTVDVADIAAVITVMAAGSEFDKQDSLQNTADVNGDGSVDVADIAAVITIMAQ